MYLEAHAMAQHLEALQRRVLTGKKLLRQVQASQCAALAEAALQRKNSLDSIQQTATSADISLRACPWSSTHGTAAPLDIDTEINERWMIA